MNVSSDTLLLSTKLKMPSPRRGYVVRKALFDQLSGCADMGVIFVCGGAGTGKTTLLSSFIHETKLKNVGWLSLDASNANVYSFWHYFAAAVGAFLDDNDGFLELLRSNFDASHMENLLTELINRLCADEDYYIVLDDVHCIRDEALTRTLEFFIGAMPENLHLFMLSREDPPVYLGELAVSGRLLFIDGRQMQLSPEEGMTFLKQTLKLSDSDEELAKLNTYAEGWIGGLQLAAAASAADKNSGKLLRAGGGIAAEYLTREIFESLAPGEREFLVGTGYLSYFDAGICEKLFNGFSAADFRSMMESLTEKNLFIICIDEQNGVYRYHNILSEYLIQQFLRLPKDRKNELLKRSSAAFEERGDSEEALRELCAAGDYDNVMRVARTMGGSIEAWSYLDKVPDDKLIEDADLAAQCFIYNIGNLDIERCRALYENFRQHYGNTDMFSAFQFAEAYVLKDTDILPEYCTLTAQQIDGFPLGPVTKAMIFVENANSLTEHMQYEEAEACINRAVELNAGTNRFVDFFALGQKAQLYEETGRLNDSLKCYAQAMEIFHSPSITSAIGINFYIGITGVYLRRMEMEEAKQALGKSQKILENQHVRFDVLDMTVLYHLAEIHFLSGEPEAGADYVRQMIVNHSNFSALNLGRLILELDCAGMLTPELTEQFLKSLEAAKNYKFQPFMRLLRARILFERGETDEALKETEEVLVFARGHENRLRLVESGLLKILMLSRCPQTAGIRREIGNLLREAINYAYENRILMPFYLDRGVLLPLLRGLDAKANNGLNAAETAFLRDAIAVCDTEHAASKEKEPEILSAREIEVLDELAKGITNREIADMLCISQATVKTHVLSIFGKLGVSSRMMAVEEGRKKGLIE